MINLFNNKTINVFSKALDVSAYRSSLLSQNIANVNTPNYKRTDINFKETMLNEVQKSDLEMARTHPLHLGNLETIGIPPNIIHETGTKLRTDGNNVDIESEMALVAENSLYFQAIAQKLKGKFDSLRQVIKGS